MMIGCMHDLPVSRAGNHTLTRYIYKNPKESEYHIDKSLRLFPPAAQTLPRDVPNGVCAAGSNSKNYVFRKVEYFGVTKIYLLYVYCKTKKELSHNHF